MGVFDKIIDTYNNYLQKINVNHAVQAVKDVEYYYIRDNGVQIEAFPFSRNSTDKSEIKACLDKGPLVYPKSDWKIQFTTSNGIKATTDRYREVLTAEGMPCITLSKGEVVHRYDILPNSWGSPALVEWLDAFFPELKKIGTARGEVFQVHLLSNSLGPDKGTFYAWRENSTLCLFGVRRGQDKNQIVKSDPQIGYVYGASTVYTRFNIPLNSIRYYKVEGSVHYEQQISGGGGGGVNYKGAVVGGLLFGGAGAIVGSRANTEAERITSNTIKVDERVCAVTVYDEKFGRNVFAFHADDIEVFDWLIPEKGYDYIIEKRRREMDELS